jgi:hypothetical protein
LPPTVGLPTGSDGGSRARRRGGWRDTVMGVSLGGGARWMGGGGHLQSWKEVGGGGEGGGRTNNGQ